MSTRLFSPIKVVCKIFKDFDMNEIVRDIASYQPYILSVRGIHPLYFFTTREIYILFNRGKVFFFYCRYFIYRRVLFLVSFEM